MTSTRETKDEITTSARSDDNAPLIFFLGSSMSGKSSSINLLMDGASVSASTLDFSLQKLTLENNLTKDKENVILVDTPALDNRSVSLFDKFIGKVKSYPVAACVFVQPRGRILAQQNDSYHIAHAAANTLRVPLIMALSFIDDDEDMHGWWNENSSDFSKIGWKFDAIVPLCGISDERLAGKLKEVQGVYIKQREKSRQFLIEALNSTALLGDKAVPILDENIFSKSSKITSPNSIFSLFTTPSVHTITSAPPEKKSRCVIM